MLQHHRLQATSLQVSLRPTPDPKQGIRMVHAQDPAFRHTNRSDARGLHELKLFRGRMVEALEGANEARDIRETRTPAGFGHVALIVREHPRRMLEAMLQQPPPR